VIGGLPRLACHACGFVLYRNPIVGVAVILLEGRSILLSRRARGPWAGMWDVPGGIVEWDEEVRDAARRELLEETGLHVEVGVVYEAHSNFHDPRQHTVGVWFLGTVIDGVMAPDDDVAELRYFPLDALPEEIAFETDRRVLERLRTEH
jgi:ADP-ribose pyrophosphatase YjhB (NUDIX family)